MKVGRQIEGRPEALQESDRAALSLANAEEHSCSTPLLCEERSQEGAQYFARELRIPGAAIAERVRQREHPLSDRDLGQHPVDEVGRGVGHAATTARRTEAAALAAKSDEAVVAAGVAVDAYESMGEYATLEIRPDLAFHEGSDGSLLRFRSGEEGDELRADDRVEEGLLGLMSRVVGDGGLSAGTGTGKGRRADASRFS